MAQIALDTTPSARFVNPRDISALYPRIRECHHMLHEGTGSGSDFRGWLTLPERYDREELERIKSAAESIRRDSEALLVVGIGGSYLGARAAITMLTHSFYNELPREQRGGPRVFFLGHNLSAPYICDLLETIADQDISVNVISKSGTTLEPALAFQMVQEFMFGRYGRDGARSRIYASTDRCRGALRTMADQEGYTSFVIPDDIGGRYSVLTPVGLLPMAVAGIDVEQVMAGARAAARELANAELKDNPCYQYAVLRHIWYAQGRTTEVLVSYEPCLFHLGEWFKQLFGESEGKGGRGIFPTAASYTTDLHSLGQYMQEGPRNLFETVLRVERPQRDLTIGSGHGAALSGLDHLAGRTINYVNSAALEATLAAHISGGVPNLLLTIPEISAYYCGYLFFFFMKACAMSAYLLGVNPFDQPGVEAYKNNLQQLLGRD